MNNNNKEFKNIKKTDNIGKINQTNGLSGLIRNGYHFKEVNEYKNKSLVKVKVTDLVCFSHLRWNFVFQRPQHLLVRWAKELKVTFIEEPVFGKYESNKLKYEFSKESRNITIVTPYINEGSSEKEINNFLTMAIKKYLVSNNINDYISWYITPMAMPFTINLNPKLVVYDCMDELSFFKGAHPDISRNEAALFRHADVIFTGGNNLYEHKKSKHFNIHPFPSSIDKKHFESGTGSKDPEDQESIAHPRVGFFGVIDERLDLELLDGLATGMPETQFIMIGPVVKINPDSLPVHPNVHYLGQKDYNQLPAYLSNWDVAFLPFAKNDSTRFISPTKTPEYLCAGKPVVSTSIHDVVNPYGALNLIHIADSVPEFISALGKAFSQINDSEWKKEVQNFLKLNSWDLTWYRMKRIIFDTIERKSVKSFESIPIQNFKSL